MAGQRHRFPLPGDAAVAGTEDDARSVVKKRPGHSAGRPGPVTGVNEADRVQAA